jgi:hypothetical protein
MAGNGNDNNGEPQPNAANGNQNNSVDGHFTDVTETGGSLDPTYNPDAPEEPLDIPLLAVGTPMEEMMATLIHAINRQGMITREQNRRIEAVEESQITRLSTSVHRRRSPQPSPRRGDHSITRSRSPRPLSPRRYRRTTSPRRHMHMPVRRNSPRQAAERHHRHRSRSPVRSTARYHRH